MDSLFHFIFPIIAALAARVHIKHPIRNILIAGVLAVLADVDHFIGIPRATTTNIFVLFFIPMLFVIYAFSRNKSYNLKGLSILIFIFLSSHLFLDIFTGGVALFYPITTTFYHINFNIPLLWSNIQGMQFEGLVASSLGVGISLFFILIIIPCFYLDEIIKKGEKHDKKLKKKIKKLAKPSK